VPDKDRVSKVVIETIQYDIDITRSILGMLNQLSSLAQIILCIF
jgi:hypothetical protein